MKFLLLTFLFVVTSCAHHHKATVHHHHESLKSVPAEDHRQGEYVIEHGKEKYYFDTEKDMSDFQKNLKQEKIKSRCRVKGKTISCPEN